MRTVDINSATPWQLAVLLVLSREELERLLLARPFGTAEAFWDSLPERHARTQPSLRWPKRDINTASVADLVVAAGVVSSTAERLVAGRPYFLERQLRTAAGDEVFKQLEPVFTTPELCFVDKLTGHQVTLTPDPTRVLVSKSESEGVDSTIRSWRLRPVFPDATRALYDVYALPDSESAGDAMSELQEQYGRNVLPAYRDDRSVSRYLNPKFCVVQFSDSVSPEQSNALISNLGLEVEEVHRAQGLYTLRIPNAQLDPGALARTLGELNSLKAVQFAEPNYLAFGDRESPLGPSMETNTSGGSPPVATPGKDAATTWNLAITRVPEAWRTTRGSPDVIIAVIDSGVDATHPALAGSILPRGTGESWNFTSEGGPEPTDDDGHGTFIAGVLVGDGSEGVTGVCPQCRLLPLKVPLNGEASSYASRRAAILYAVARARTVGRLIINLSWKTTGDVSLIRDAIDVAVASGATIVASAGNFPERENQPHFPSDYPAVIAVGAVTRKGQRAPYSFYGDEVDVAAPGGDEHDKEGTIVSASSGGGTTTRFGTSFAAPHVAGVAALVMSIDSSVLPSRVRSAIEDSAVGLPGTGLGHGLCDAERAVGADAVRPAPRVDPLMVLNSAAREALMHEYGLKALTARLIIARRPIARLEDIEGTLGLTESEFQAIKTQRGSEQEDAAFGGGQFGGGGASGTW